MAVDLLTALRSLANSWTMKARDYARQSKEAESDQAAYYRGFAEGYYKAATELAALIKDAPARPAAPTVAAPPRPETQGLRRGAVPTQRSAPKVEATIPAPPSAPSTPAAPPTEIYASVSVGEALSVLDFAGCAARDIEQRKDNSFHVIFSRWENMMPHERIERIQKVDNRIVILDNGKLDTHDHYVDFAFKES